jgi:hypothetical protein
LYASAYVYSCCEIKEIEAKRTGGKESSGIRNVHVLISFKYPQTLEGPAGSTGVRMYMALPLKFILSLGDTAFPCPGVKLLLSFSSCKDVFKIKTYFFIL